MTKKKGEVIELKEGEEYTIVEVKEILLQIADVVKEGKAHEIPAIFLWGPPGVGKSSVVRQVAEEKGMLVEDLRLSQLDIPDLRGIPTIERVNTTRVVTWAVPAFLPKSEPNQTKAKEPGFLFLDEFNLADPSIQATAYQLVLDRRVGEYRLPDNWYVMAAGNRRKEAINVYDMPKPLISRFIHIIVVPSFDAWLPWALKVGIDERIIAFLKFKPQYFYHLVPESPEIAYPCPRTWEFASKMLKITGECKVVGTAVGPTVGAEFCHFAKIFKDIPNIDEILDMDIEELRKKFEKNPIFPYKLEGDKVDPALWSAISSALALRTIQVKDETQRDKRINNVLNIAYQLHVNGYGEWSTFLTTSLGFKAEEIKEIYKKFEPYRRLIAKRVEEKERLRKLEEEERLKEKES